MAIFKYPLNNNNTIETNEYDNSYAKLNGTTNNEFTVNSDDINNNIILVADRHEYMEGGPTTIKSFIQTNGYKQITMGTNAYGSVTCMGEIDDDTDIPRASIGISVCDSDLNYKGISINVDPTTQYIRIGYEFDEYYLLIEPATITMRGGKVPVYHGELTNAPTTYAAGDEYYNTNDLKFYKYNNSSWIALN